MRLVVARQLAAMEHGLTVREHGSGIGTRGEAQSPHTDEHSDALGQDDIHASPIGPQAAIPAGPADAAQISTAQTLPDLNQPGDSATPGDAFASGAPAIDSSRKSAGRQSCDRGEGGSGRSDRLVAPPWRGRRRADRAWNHFAKRVGRRCDPGVTTKPAAVSRFTTVEEDERRRAEEDRRLESGPRSGADHAVGPEPRSHHWVGILFVEAALRGSIIRANRNGRRRREARPPAGRGGRHPPVLGAVLGRPAGSKDKKLFGNDRLPAPGSAAAAAASRGSRHRAAPIERDYLEAISYAAAAPQRATAKLQAIVTLYGSTTQPDETTDQILKLTNLQLTRLRQQSEREAPEGMTVIEANLHRAEHLRTVNSAEARAIWTSIVELYSETPWAAAQVARAKAALAEMNRGK